MSETDLAFIQRCVREGRVLWTYHVNMRLWQRGMSRNAILEHTNNYQIIEQYAQSQASRYLPSVLVYTEHDVGAIHVLFALDLEGENVRVITAYRPDPSRWHSNLKERKDS